MDVSSAFAAILAALLIGAMSPGPSFIMVARETLINGPTSEVAGEMASNFLDDEANRRSIQ